MRNLFDPDEVMSPSLLKTATWILTLMLIAIAAIFAISALGHVLKFRFVAAATQILAGVGAPLGLWVVVRLLSELTIGNRQLADRLSVVADSLSEDRQTAATTEAATTEEEAPVSTVEDDAEMSSEAVSEEPTEEEPKPKRRRKSAKTDED